MTSASPFRRDEPHRKLARLLQALFSRVSSLSALATQLRALVTNGAAFARFGICLDELRRELQTAARMLAARAEALGWHVAAKPGGRKTPKPVRLCARAAKSLCAGCRGCSRQLHALLQIAHEAHDEASARVAVWLMRTIERLLWVLQPADRPTPAPESLPA